MYGVLIIYPSDPKLRDISLSPNGDKLLATFYLSCTRVTYPLQVSFGPSSVSKTLYFSAILMDLRLLEDDPAVPRYDDNQHVFWEYGLDEQDIRCFCIGGEHHQAGAAADQGNDREERDQGADHQLYRDVNNHLFLQFMSVI